MTPAEQQIILNAMITGLTAQGRALNCYERRGLSSLMREAADHFGAGHALPETLRRLHDVCVPGRFTEAEPVLGREITRLADACSRTVATERGDIHG
jgi:hypothetical protein